ncbi:MAG: PcfJ domain-containing protein [Alphaproteobacteria bacterium]|nr:PcfJ domain-containing protein [Alphaproteobacteria bacterium]
MITQSEKHEAIERQIGRFERSIRRRLRKLAGLSPRLGDLIMSFPAAAFAIASDSVDADSTGLAVRRVKEGCGLKDVATTLGLPMWLKRVPPEAFHGKLLAVPGGEKFAQKISGRIPKNPAYATCWLNWVSFASKAADDEFALWIASQKPPYVRPLPVEQIPLRPLAMFAWFSMNSDGQARDLIKKPWQPSMRFETATDGMQVWIDEVAGLFKPVRPHRGPGRYSRRQEGGLRMVALRNGPQLREEGRLMNHCVGTYAHLVAAGDCMIFSVRDGDQRLATVEVRRHSRSGTYQIVQLQGHSNRRPSEQVRRFAHDWMQQFAGAPNRGLKHADGEFRVKKDDWNKLWRPYMEAKGRAGLEASEASLERLISDADIIRHSHDGG